MRTNILDYKLLILVTFIFCFTFTSCKRKEPESPFKSKLPDYNLTSTITTVDEASESNEASEPTVLGQEGEDLEVMSLEIDTNSNISPTSIQIQTALKNASYYEGEIDGKIGPKSKKAISEFQRDNSLEVDGKVGPKTWAKLKDYLNSPKEKD